MLLDPVTLSRYTAQSETPMGKAALLRDMRSLCVSWAVALDVSDTRGILDSSEAIQALDRYEAMYLASS